MIADAVMVAASKQLRDHDEAYIKALASSTGSKVTEGVGKLLKKMFGR